MTDNELRAIAEAARKYPQPEITADDRYQGAGIVRNSKAADKAAMAERMLGGGMDDCPLLRSLARVRVHGIFAGGGEYVPATFDPPTIIALLDRLAAHEAERAADKARIAELEGALAPFTKYRPVSIGVANPEDAGTVRIICNAPAGEQPRFGHFEAARTALERTKP